MKKLFVFLIFALLLSGCHWNLRITDPFLTPHTVYVKPKPKVIVIKSKPKVIVIKSKPKVIVVKKKKKKVKKRVKIFIK
jgi:hypothetical protein